MEMSICNPRFAYGVFTGSFPDIYAALTDLGKAIGASGIEPELVELVELRVSQINGCAFCMQHHLGAARRLGIDSAKIDLLAAWHDAGVFSEREMAALAWAEALTRLDSHVLHDQVWATLKEQFTEGEAVALTTAIGAINAWNRLGVGFRFAPHGRGSNGKAGN
jgi:AhpD family alkylhydroperoxidase